MRLKQIFVPAVAVKDNVDLVGNAPVPTNDPVYVPDNATVPVP